MVETKSVTIGQKFDRLTVVSINEKAKFQTCCCLCICGITKTIRIYNLLSGDTKSCGCLGIEKRKEGIRKKALQRAFLLINKKVGILTIKNHTGFDNFNNSLLECLCDCGNKTIISLTKLNKKTTFSCGCVRSASIMSTKRTNSITKGNFKGVYSRGKKFAAVTSGKHLGSFLTTIEAAKAYDKASFEKYGIAEILNFPEDYSDE